MSKQTVDLNGKLMPLFFYVATLLSFALMFIYWFRLQFIPVHTTPLNYLFNVGIAAIYFIGTIIGGVLLGHEEISSKKRFFFYMTLSLFFSGLAMSIWSYYNIILHIASPYPSIADLFFILYTGCLGIGFWHYFDLLKIDLKKRNLIEAILIIFVVCIFMFFIIDQPQYSRAMSVTEIMFNYLYPLSDAVTLGVALVIIRNTGIKHSGIVLLFLSVMFLIVGDLLFSIRTYNQTYWNGDYADLFFLFSATLQTLGIIYAYFDSETILQVAHIKNHESK